MDDAVNQSKPTVAGEVKKNKKSPGPPPPNLLIEPKPKLSKAERRTLQEQQRAAKAARQGSASSTTKPPVKSAEKDSSAPSSAQSKPAPTKADRTVDAVVPSSTMPLVVSSETSNSNVTGNNTTTTTTTATVITATNLLVGHLPRVPPVNVTFDTGAVLRVVANFSNNKKTTTSDQPYPDAVVRLGYLYATGQIRGGNARCRAMLECYQEILAANSSSSSVAPDVLIKSAFQFWTTQCRAHSVTMGNAFTFLKAAVASLMQQHDAVTIRETLLEIIETYKQERIEYADKAIADIACQKLLSNQDEVILTFGYSEAVALVLEEAQMKRVIVVDSPPLLEGLYTYNSLSKTPEYIDISALTYVLPEVDKVLLGAAAVQTDGSVTGRIGTAVVALAAHAHHIPVLVCAETYKISNRGVPLESLTHNEVLANQSSREGQPSSSTSLQLLYDLTPAKWISGIVTELGLVPPSSVAVLLREMNPQEFKAAQ